MENQADLYKTTLTETIEDFKSLMAQDLRIIKDLVKKMEADTTRIPLLAANLSQIAARLQENTSAMKALQNVALYANRWCSVDITLP